MRRSILSRPALHVTAPAGVRMGRAAWRALRAGHGSVAAAFTSAVYIAGERGIACLVPASTPCGPLNVTLRGFRPGTPDLQGAPWRTIGSDLVVDGLGSFAISPSDEWTPASLPSASACALRDGLDAMRAALAARAPRGELLGHVPGSVPEVRPTGCPGQPPCRLRWARTLRGPFPRSRRGWKRCCPGEAHRARPRSSTCWVPGAVSHPPAMTASSGSSSRCARSGNATSHPSSRASSPGMRHAAPHV